MVIVCIVIAMSEKEGEIMLPRQELLDLYERAESAYNRGDFDLAIRLLKKILGQCPKEYPALNSLGTCYYLQGRKREALHAFRLAVRLAGNNFQVHFNFIFALIVQGCIDEAAAELEEFLPGLMHDVLKARLLAAQGRSVEAKMLWSLVASSLQPLPAELRRVAVQRAEL